MKLIASVLFAAALASPSGRARSGSGSGKSGSAKTGSAKSGSPASPAGSGRSASSMWDDVMSGIMKSPSNDGEKKSGHEDRSGRPRPGHGDHDKPEYHDGKPEHGKQEHDKPEYHDQKPQKGEKGCNGCGGAVNSNYAPMNSNVQNFLNIETDVNTNVNMNMGGFGYQMPNKHHDWDKEWDWDKEHGKDKDKHDDKDPAEHPEWGWDEIRDLDHADESMGWPVWGGVGDISMRDIIHVIGSKLGIEKPEDIHELLEKEEVREILQGFLHSLNNSPDVVPATTDAMTTGMDMTTKNQRPKTA